MGNLVLLIQGDRRDAGALWRTLDRNAAGEYKLQCVASVATALARIAGGGVDVVLLDLSVRDHHQSDGLSGFLAMRKVAPHVPVVVLYDAADEGLALRAMRAGAADYVPMGAGDDGESISPAIRSAIKLGRQAREPRHRAAAAQLPPRGVIAFMGAKGGVGATTIAMNVAAVLARQNRVILVEIRPAFGSLPLYLKPFGQRRNISHLLGSEAAEIGAAEVDACLWPCTKAAGLSVLFGPLVASECAELVPNRVAKLIKTLAGLADFVVLDLPCSLSGANRAAAAASGRLVLVTERDPVCVQAAKLMARSIQDWPGTPQPIDIVLLNRSAVSCPMPLSEIEAQLGMPALAVVPPAPEICLAAQQAHTPIVAHQDDSLIADCLTDLAGKCKLQLRQTPAQPSGRTLITT